MKNESRAELEDRTNGKLIVLKVLIFNSCISLCHNDSIYANGFRCGSCVTTAAFGLPLATIIIINGWAKEERERESETRQQQP